MISIYDRVKKHCEKGENAGNRHFLLFPQCFQYNPFPKSHSKSELCGNGFTIADPFWNPCG